MDANHVPSSPGFKRLEEAAPCTSRSGLASTPAAAVVPPESGRPMDANHVPSSPGSKRLEEACSSPPPHASRAPLSSSSSSVPDPPPRRNPTLLAEPSASASREGSQRRDIMLEVHLVTRDGLDTVEEVAFQSSQTVQDIKEYFENDKGRDVCVAQNMVIYHDGVELSNMIILETLDLKKRKAILLTYEEDRSQPTSDLATIQDALVDEDFGLWRYKSYSTTTPDYDYPSTVGQSDISDISTAIGEIPIGITETALAITAETVLPSAITQEPSASASREGSQWSDIMLEVHLVTRDGLDTVKVAFQSSQTVQDLLEYFEKERGSDVCCAENMVAYHDGTKLSSMTIFKTLDLEKWNEILLTYEVSQDISQPGSNLAPIHGAIVDEGLILPVYNFPWEAANQDYGILIHESDVSPPTQTNVEHMVDQFGTHTVDCDRPSTLGHDTAEISTAIGEIPIGIVETARFITAETPSSETLANLATPICSQVLIGRLLIPETSADFFDRLLYETQLHGFKTVHELMDDINRGPPKWITKKQALGLLYNAEMFSIGDVQDDAKKDGLSCVIDSTKCQISKSLGGYSSVENMRSSENVIGKMKEKGVEMDWFEVRGKVWSRRRLALRGGDGVFHLLQWKHHQNAEKEAAGRASTSVLHSTELRHGVPDSATGASTPGETTHGVEEESSVGARGGGFDEMKALIHDFQTAVCSKFKEFQTTVTAQLSQFDSHLQRIDARVETIEQQRNSTPSLGSTMDCRQSSSRANPLPPSDD